LDYVALTNRIDKIKPIVIFPEAVSRSGINDQKALEALLDSTKHLVSMPGQEYQISYCIPDEAASYDVFLYSKGYYLEWIRAHWVTDKNLGMLNLILAQLPFSTDCQYFRAQGVPVYSFTPIRLPKSMPKSAHSIDEHFSLSALVPGKNAYVKILKALMTPQDAIITAAVKADLPIIQGY